MLQLSIDELVKKTGNRYTLTIAASKRARQLIDRNEDQDAFRLEKPLTIATKEILTGELEMSKPHEDL